MCAVLVDQHSDAFSGRHGTWALPTYREYMAEFRLRKSMYVKITAVRTSTAAATARVEVAITCPPNAQVVGLEHEPYTYLEEMATEHQ